MKLGVICPHDRGDDRHGLEVVMKRVDGDTRDVDDEQQKGYCDEEGAYDSSK